MTHREINGMLRASLCCLLGRWGVGMRNVSMSLIVAMAGDTVAC